MSNVINKYKVRIILGNDPVYMDDSKNQNRIDTTFDNPMKALRGLAELVNGVSGERRVALLYSNEIEQMINFADTFTDGEDPEDNPLAGDIIRIVDERLR